MTTFPVIWTKKQNRRADRPLAHFQDLTFMPFYCCQSLLVADREAEDMNYYRNTNHDVAPRSNCRRRIVTKEMAFYCFDILSSHLYRHQEPPWPPTFPNGELWVSWVSLFYLQFSRTLSFHSSPFCCSSVRDLKQKACLGELRGFSIHDNKRSVKIHRSRRNSFWSLRYQERICFWSQILYLMSHTLF